MKPVQRTRISLLLALCACVLCACPSTHRSVPSHPKGPHPAFTYRNDLGYSGPGQYRGLGNERMGSFLFFSHEQADEPAAYIVFMHLKGPHKQQNVRYRDRARNEISTLPEVLTYPSPPEIFLDGRAVPDSCIAYLASMNDANAADPGFLRIRPGEHHLHIRVNFTSYDTRDDLEYEDVQGYTLFTDPFDHVISLRSGDVYMVTSGVLGGGSHHGDATRTATRTTLIPREQMAPNVAQGGFPGAGQLLAQAQERAAQGDPAALFDLGQRHLLAIGLPQDTIRGKELVRRAAEAGYLPAMRMMANIEVLLPMDGMSMSERRRRHERASAWYGKTLERGCRVSGELLLQYYRTRRKTDEMQQKIERLQARLQDLRDPERMGISQHDVVKQVSALATASKPEQSVVVDDELEAITREARAEFQAHSKARRRLAESDYEGALEVVDKGLEASPTSWLLLTAKGDTLLQLLRYEGALAAYEAASRHVVVFDDPTPAWATWHGQGLALVRLRRFDEAEQALRTALKWKADATSHFVLANALSSRGDLQAAVTELDGAIELAPNYGSAYGTRALYRARLGDKDGAVADYRQVEKRAPKLLPIVAMGLKDLGIALPK